MSITYREWWGLIHGMGLGALFLLAFAGGLAGLYSLRPALITPEGVVERLRRLKVGVVAMAVVAWLTVISGTWVVYPWYRAKGPGSPRSQLLCAAPRSPCLCSRSPSPPWRARSAPSSPRSPRSSKGGGWHGRRSRAAPGRRAP